MPGNIIVSTPTTVFPRGLAVAFALRTDNPCDKAEYLDGRSQRSPLTDSPRRTWVQTRKLTGPLTDQLAAFYLSHQGSLKNFYFYDPFGTDNTGAHRFNYDATGVSPIGRHLCRFEGSFSQTWAPGRIQSNFSIVECDA